MSDIFISYTKNAANTYLAKLYLGQSIVHDESRPYLEETVEKFELDKKLIKLGWSDNRMALEFFKLSVMPKEERPPKPTLIKQWEQGDDLVAITNFLIDTNRLLSAKLSDIKVNLQIDEFATSI